MRTADGRSAFLKGAVDEDTAAWLRAKHRIYTGVNGGFLSALLGWWDDDDRPVLLLEAAWLEGALPDLVAAEEACRLADDRLVHFDVRSDNICFSGERTFPVDWNFAVVGNPLIDVAAWLPSLHAEGGPVPDEILPDAPEAAALIAGVFAARAGLPRIEPAPRVREVQLVQLRTALPWAARALGLPEPA